MVKKIPSTARLKKKEKKDGKGWLTHAPFKGPSLNPKDILRKGIL